MENESKKTLAEALVLANRIEGKTNNNEALGRAILSFQNEFDNRKLDVPIDVDENINFSGNLIEQSLENTREIRKMNEDLRNKLVLLADELFHGN